jgi:hypothetical protein
MRRRLVLVCMLLVLLLAAPFVVRPAKAASPPVPAVNATVSGNIFCFHWYAISLGSCTSW